MLPVPESRRCGTTARVARTAACRLELYVASQTSSVSSRARVPALFTSASSRPKRATVSVTSRSMSFACETSATMPSASTPRSRSSASVWRNASSPRAQMATRQPSPAKARAIERPMPRLPPVTIATLSRRPRSMLPLLCHPERSEGSRSSVNQCSLRSSHSGLADSIKASFLLLRQPFSSFSRAIAV